MGLHYDSYMAGIKPDPAYTVWEWADAKRILSSVAAAEPGPYRTARTPYFREIMEELSPRSRTEHVVLMKGAQIGATEVGNNLVGFAIDHAPGPMIYVLPTLDMAKRTSRQRLQPMIDACPALSEKVKDRRARDSGNAMLAKEFPGGILILTGANSPVGLRSMPARYAILDECDAYEHDVGGEGDPVSLVVKRTETFKRNRKIFELSTPTLHLLSRIEASFEVSDKRYYYVACPHCGDRAPIFWHRIIWQKDENGEHLPETAALQCEACGKLIEERYKTQLLAGGRWIATAKGDGRTVGFHLSALYSPLGWYSWADAARDLLKADHEPGLEALKTWTNTVLAETWSDPGETVDHSALYARREHYNAEVPDEVLLLTAGVDVQADRLEVTVDGWGDSEERWTLFHRVLWGDPSRGEVWGDLDDVLEGVYETAGGAGFHVAAACVDSGYLTTRVYDYIKPRQVRRIYATKGVAGPGRPIVAAPQRKRTGRQRLPVRLFTLGADSAKSLVYRRLRLTEPGAGYHHFPVHETIDETYFEQLTAEKKVVKHVKGFPVEEWQLVRPRNEALDCAVLSLAALAILRPNWAKLVERAAAEAPEAPENKDKKTPKPRGRPVRRKGSGFVKGWKK